MNNQIVLLVIGIFGGLGISGFLVGINNQAQAQVDPNDRFFQKDFCQAEQTLLDDIIYNDGNPLSYDSTGCPVSIKVIHHWNDIPQARQTVITTRLSTNGYTDVTNQMQELISR